MKLKIDPNAVPLRSIGIDIGKEIFHVVGLGTDGKIAFLRKIKRLALKEAFEKLLPCIVGMEACLSAHFVSRMLKALGAFRRLSAAQRAGSTTTSSVATTSETPAAIVAAIPYLGDW